MTHNSERFNNSKFVKTVGENVFKFYGKHLKEIRSKGLGISKLDTYGTPKEILLKSIFNELNSIREYYDDLEIILKFFKIDRDKIKILYSDNILDEDYYKFHYDNFVIRILTSIDLCGKIGCRVYQLKIKNDSWYQFVQHKMIKGSEVEKSLMAFSVYLEKLRQHRHEKVHTGKSKDNEFDKIVFWENMLNLIGASMNKDDIDILNEYTNDEIKAKNI
jgi:hypothetical protein